MAVMLGALMIHGISPWTNVLVNPHAPLFWDFVASFLIGNLLTVGAQHSLDWNVD